MKKLNVAIIGQGRSGRDIHGKYLLTENNKYYNVKYVVDADAGRRERAEKEYEGCKAFASYEELFGIKDIDLVINSTFSQMHYPVTLDLLNHGFNVLVEKPFARTKLECQTLIETAREKGVVLAVFQQSFFAPYYVFAKQVADSGKLGDIKEVGDHDTLMAKGGEYYTLFSTQAKRYISTENDQVLTENYDASRHAPPKLPNGKRPDGMPPHRRPPHTKPDDSE